MIIRSFFTLDNNIYRISIRTEDWSELDLRLMEKYGEPEIDLGGTLWDGTQNFDLDTYYRRIKSESPFAQGFDARDSTFAEVRAEAWESAVTGRITTAVTTLRANDDDYSREEIATV